MLARARVVLLASVAVAVILLGAKLPLGQLAGQNAAAARYSTELARVRAENRALAAQIKRLGTPSEIATIAHGEYGLIYPGQRSVVILPSSNVPSAGPSPLAENLLAPGLIVPSDVRSGPPVVAGGTGPGASLLGRVLQRLEFWRWAF